MPARDGWGELNSEDVEGITHKKRVRKERNKLPGIKVQNVCCNKAKRQTAASPLSRDVEPCISLECHQGNRTDFSSCIDRETRRHPKPTSVTTPAQNLRISNSSNPLSPELLASNRPNLHAPAHDGVRTAEAQRRIPDQTRKPHQTAGQARDGPPRMP